MSNYTDTERLNWVIENGARCSEGYNTEGLKSYTLWWVEWDTVEADGSSYVRDRSLRRAIDKAIKATSPPLEKAKGAA